MAEKVVQNFRNADGCNHLIPVWDHHSYCFHCRHSKLGTDLCAIGEEGCYNCLALSENQVALLKTMEEKRARSSVYDDDSLLDSDTPEMPHLNVECSKTTPTLEESVASLAQQVLMLNQKFMAAEEEKKKSASKSRSKRKPTTTRVANTISHTLDNSAITDKSATTERSATTEKSATTERSAPTEKSATAQKTSKAEKRGPQTSVDSEKQSTSTPASGFQSSREETFDTSTLYSSMQTYSRSPPATESGTEVRSHKRRKTERPKVIESTPASRSDEEEKAYNFPETIEKIRQYFDLEKEQPPAKGPPSIFGPTFESRNPTTDIPCLPHVPGLKKMWDYYYRKADGQDTNPENKEKSENSTKDERPKRIHTPMPAGTFIPFTKFKSQFYEIYPNDISFTAPSLQSAFKNITKHSSSLPTQMMTKTNHYTTWESICRENLQIFNMVSFYQQSTCRISQDISCEVDEISKADHLETINDCTSSVKKFLKLQHSINDNMTRALEKLHENTITLAINIQLNRRDNLLKNCHTDVMDSDIANLRTSPFTSAELFPTEELAKVEKAYLRRRQLPKCSTSRPRQENKPSSFSQSAFAPKEKSMKKPYKRPDFVKNENQFRNDSTKSARSANSRAQTRTGRGRRQ